MLDQEWYDLYLERAQESHEGLCRRCGACCGAAEDDPCIHLVKTKENFCVCSIYENRLGIHKTINGNEFKCVPLRNIIFGFWQGASNCGYKRRMRKA